VPCALLVQCLPSPLAQLKPGRPQPFSYYGWDNRHVCDLAGAHRTQVAGICLLDPDDPESPRMLENLVSQFGMRGLRSYTAANGRLDEPCVWALWRKASDLEIAVNVSVSAEKIDELAAMISSFPSLPVVIDHCLTSQPTSELPRIIKEIVGLGRFPNAYAKLSFLPLASTEQYPFRDMHEPCEKIIAAFGPERCVWGNVFPSELWSPQSSYAQNLRLFTAELELGDLARACILGKTANRLWFNGRLCEQ
jgi:predicted TIM-barrel fold metal-dependent hydrolase